VFRRSLLRCSLAAFATAAIALAQPANAQSTNTPATSAPAQTEQPDTVIVAPKPDEPGRIIMSGRVVDYTGAALVIELSSGKQTVPGKRVVEIRSTWHADQLAGEELWRRREYAAAQAKFQAAFDVEQRRWVRRKLQARIVDCLREDERWGTAADAFMLLLRDDPTTPYFGSIPLPWTSVFPDAALETKAKKWAAERTNSAAALFGSAVLLSTQSRLDGVNRLKELMLDGDPRIALSAEAQLWRTGTVTADRETVDAWERKLDKLPEDLAAGPAVVVGKAWAQRVVAKDGATAEQAAATRATAERAALVLLRVPILHREQHRLAAEALWSAGQMLEQLENKDRAVELYRELQREYPQAPIAGSAADRLKELTTETKTP